MATTISIHQSIYDEIVRLTSALKDQTEGWFSRHGSDRNRLARQAANDNLDKARTLSSLIGGDSRALVDKMYAYYEEITGYERQFRNWGGHRNSYAEEIHRLGAEAFLAGHNRLNPLTRTVLDVKATLVLSWMHEGGLEEGRGRLVREYTLLRGYESETAETETIHSQVTNKIGVNFSGEGLGLSGGFDASHEHITREDILNSTTVRNTRRETVTESIDIDWVEPVYVYFVKYDYTLGDHSVRSCYGDGELRFSRPLENSIPITAVARL